MSVPSTPLGASSEAPRSPELAEGRDTFSAAVPPSLAADTSAQEHEGTTRPAVSHLRLPADEGKVRREGRLTEEIMATRRAYIAPLFAYLTNHYISAIAIARRAALAAGVIQTLDTPDTANTAERPRQRRISRTRLTLIKQGRCPTPGWFIAGICREIGQPVEVVMGQEWAQRHLPLPTGADFGADLGADDLDHARERTVHRQQVDKKAS